MIPRMAYEIGLDIQRLQSIERGAKENIRRTRAFMLVNEFR